MISLTEIHLPLICGGMDNEYWVSNQVFFLISLAVGTMVGSVFAWYLDDPVFCLIGAMGGWGFGAGAML